MCDAAAVCLIVVVPLFERDMVLWLLLFCCCSVFFEKLYIVKNANVSGKTALSLVELVKYRTSTFNTNTYTSS